MTENNGEVSVQVVQLASDRQIAWGDVTIEKLKARLDDVRTAIVEGAAAVAAGVTGVATVDGWRTEEVSVTFGVSLVAEAGVVLTRASAETTFEISVTWRRSQ